MSQREKLLEVKDLCVSFGTKRKEFKAVKNVSFDIYKGETFGLVGESGSGKTTIGRSIIRINKVKSGEIRFEDKIISGKVDANTKKYVIENIQMVFQDPMSSLNERAKVEYIVAEGLLAKNPFSKQSEYRPAVLNAMETVGLLPEFASRFPHEFSGGQRQRIGISRTLVMKPKLIIADEPISALDVSIRAQVLNLLTELRENHGLTYLFIAHDLSVVRFFCDRIAVLYKGQIMEMAKTELLFQNPLHPYTKALLSSIPLPNPIIEKQKKVLVYDPSQDDYGTETPTLREVEPEHFVLANDKKEAEYRNIIASKR